MGAHKVSGIVQKVFSKGDREKGTNAAFNGQKEASATKNFHISNLINTVWYPRSISTSTINSISMYNVLSRIYIIICIP